MLCIGNNNYISFLECKIRVNWNIRECLINRDQLIKLFESISLKFQTMKSLGLLLGSTDIDYQVWIFDSLWMFLSFNLESLRQSPVHVVFRAGLHLVNLWASPKQILGFVCA